MTSVRSDKAWYVNFGDGSTTGYYAVPVWAALTIYAAGAVVRQLTAPAVNSERCFVCVVAGTTDATTEPTWVVTRGALVTDGTVTWQECTGHPALCGDASNVNTRAEVKAASTDAVLGQVCKNTTSPDTYFICTVAGAMGESEPASWDKTAGNVTTDSTARWTCLGAISAFTTAFAYPHARIKNAMTATWVAAGKIVGVASNHAETQDSAMSIAGIGSIASPVNVYCIDVATTLANPTMATSATVSTTGNSALTVVADNLAFYHGISFSCSSGATQALLSLVGTALAGASYVFEDCSFIQGATGENKFVFGNNDPMCVYLKNSYLVFSHASSSIRAGNTQYGGAVVSFYMDGGGIAATGTAPTSLFESAAYGVVAAFVLRNVNLSNLPSINFYVGSAGLNVTYQLQNCRTKSGATFSTSSGTSFLNGSFKVHNCDSSGTNYLVRLSRFTGLLTQETSIVRAGGATDGTTPISWNIVSSATSSFYLPFISEEISAWNDTTGSALTATVYLTTDAALQDADVWIEVEYPSSASYPLGATVTTRPASVFTTPTNLTADATSTWGGAAKTYKYKIISPEFTPAMKGPVKVRVYVAKPSTTIYLDPAPVITGITNGNSYLIAGWGYLCQAAAAAAAGGAALSRIFTGM